MSLVSSDISDVGATAILEALKTNTTLKYLNMTQNKIDEKLMNDINIRLDINIVRKRIGFMNRLSDKKALNFNNVSFL